MRERVLDAEGEKAEARPGRKKKKRPLLLGEEEEAGGGEWLDRSEKS